jgi:hypothetical protein
MPKHKPEFIPTPAEIEETCRKIQEEGFWDNQGIWHPPWDDYRRMRKSQHSQSDHNPGDTFPTIPRIN